MLFGATANLLPHVKIVILHYRITIFIWGSCYKLLCKRSMSEVCAIVEYIFLPKNEFYANKNTPIVRRILIFFKIVPRLISRIATRD